METIDTAIRYAALVEVEGLAVHQPDAAHTLSRLKRDIEPLVESFSLLTDLTGAFDSAASAAEFALAVSLLEPVGSDVMQPLKDLANGVRQHLDEIRHALLPIVIEWQRFADESELDDIKFASDFLARVVLEMDEGNLVGWLNFPELGTNREVARILYSVSLALPGSPVDLEHKRLTPREAWSYAKRIDKSLGWSFEREQMAFVMGPAGARLERAQYLARLISGPHADIDKLLRGHVVSSGLPERLSPEGVDEVVRLLRVLWFENVPPKLEP